MSNTTDQFFEDEEDLAREQSAAGGKDRKGRPAPDASGKPAAGGKPAGKARAATPATPAAGGKGGAKPPTFGMVVAIAAVALVLGVCIGYFFAMSVVDKTRSAGTAATTTAATTSASTSDSTDDTGSLPSGHPDLSTLMNADGTVNEEALAEYRAKRAAEEAATEGASESAETADADASKAADAAGTTGSSGSSEGK